MYCTKCGMQNSEEAKFCRGCGNKLSAPEAGQTVGVNPEKDEWKENGQAQPEAAVQRASAQNNYAQSGYNQSGQNSYGQNGYAQPGYNQSGYHQFGQNGYSQNGYDQNGYAQGTYDRPKKKGKKGIVLLVILLVVVAFGIFAGVKIAKTSKPSYPVEAFMDNMFSGKFEKAYSCLYFGEGSDLNGKQDFINEMEQSVGSMQTLLALAKDAIKVRVVSEGETYRGSDGMQRKDLTVEMTISFFGQSETDTTSVTVVKSGKTFLFFPSWQIDATVDSDLLDGLF